MHFAVLFEDNPAKSDLRQQHMQAHLAFLAENAAQILAAGPMFDAEQGAGGLWLVEAPDQDTVEALVEADPFWPTGLRASVRVLEWRRVFADGTRLI
jgi:uncharacterized protein YciI